MLANPDEGEGKTNTLQKVKTIKMEGIVKDAKGLGKSGMVSKSSSRAGQSERRKASLGAQLDILAEQEATRQ